MPLYEFVCHHCDTLYDEYRSLADYDNALPVCKCGIRMCRSYRTAPAMRGDLQPYRNPITNEMITSRSQEREELRKHNCIQVGNDTQYISRKTEYIDTDKPGMLERAIGDAYDEYKSKHG